MSVHCKDVLFDDFFKFGASDVRLYIIDCHTIGKNLVNQLGHQRHKHVHLGKFFIRSFDSKLKLLLFVVFAAL